MTAFNESDYNIDRSNCGGRRNCSHVSKQIYDSSLPGWTSIIRNDNVHDDVLLCDTAFNVVHCSTFLNGMLLVFKLRLSLLLLANVPLLGGAVPQTVKLFHFVSVFLDTARWCKSGDR